MTTNPPPSKKYRLRWWHPLCYLAVSLLLWWGVDKLLEPWPLWSKTYTEGKGLLPLCEQDNGPYLLGTEYRHIAGTTQMEPRALLVIDKQTGRELHRLATSDSNLLNNIGFNDSPRIYGDVIWRLSIERSSWGAIYRLCSLKYKEENTEKTVHTWNVPEGSHFGFNWPLQSKVLVIRRQWPPMMKFWKYSLNPMIMLAIDLMNDPFSYQMPCWFETWQLPESPDQPLQKLAQWPVPYDRIHADWHCSDDGKQLALLESAGNWWLAKSRAQKSGKQVFRGRELFNLYRSDDKGLLLYKTATGKSTHSFQDDYAPHTTRGWHGQYLVTSGKKENNTLEISVTDFSSKELEFNPKSYYQHIFSDEYHIQRVDDQGVHHIDIPQYYRQADVRFAYNRNRLEGRSGTLDAHQYYQLAIENNQLITLQQFQTPRDSHLHFRSWLPSSAGKQFLVFADSPWLKRVKSWQGKWTVLDRLLKKVEDHLSSSPTQLQVHCDETGSRRVHAFDLYPVMSPNATDSNLYLSKTHYDELKSITGSTLYAYTLPIKLYSPWWHRFASLLPWLWLVWLLRRPYRLK